MKSKVWKKDWSAKMFLNIPKKPQIKGQITQWPNVKQRSTKHYTET